MKKQKKRKFTYVCQVCADLFVRTHAMRTDKCPACDLGWLKLIRD